jgi:transcriptional regulator with XRE-family HTH domain
MMTRGAIAKIESGVRKSVTADEVAVLARALGVTAQYLMTPAALGQARGPAEPVPAQQAPLFFLSYAPSFVRRSGDQSGEGYSPVADFFDDLSENLGHLVSRPAGTDPGFMDSSLHPGNEWLGELLGNLGTCQSLVALLSVPYYTSEWCGRQWHAFSQRKVTSSTGSEHETGIIPVIWAPFPMERVPAAVSRIQSFTPSDLPDLSVAEEYAKFGLFGLMRMKRDAVYQSVVWALAKHIADFVYTRSVEPRSFQPHELRNVFTEAEP